MKANNYLAYSKHPISRILFILSLLLIFWTPISAQTNYSPPYTSANFVKTIDLSRPVGTIEASPGTTPSGGVTYSFPIYTPPGTNGMEPPISITYNSQGGPSIAGFGWNITGLSAISRTGKNLYHNNVVSPVTYTMEDAFLLDGMRLNPTGPIVGSIVYYRTEAESFSFIESILYGSPINPFRFLVTAKDGSMLQFGYTSDSRVMTDDGQNVMLWRLNRIIDINGNYVDFTYDNSNRDSRIDEINYTGNTITGLLPYNKIKFNYGNRYEINTAYDGGASMSDIYLLNNITITNTNDNNAIEQVKKYQFNYAFDNVHSLLKEVEEYGEGVVSPDVLNSTIFLYGDPPVNTSEQTTIPFVGECLTGDFNADGKTDILASEYYYDQNIKYSSGYKIFLDPQSSVPLYEKTLEPGHIIAENRHLTNFLVGDYNGDGRDDVLHIKTKIVTYPSGNTEWQVERFTIEYSTSTGSSPTFLPMPSGNVIHPSGNFFIPGDFDGDGNQDYITILRNSSSSYFYAYLCPPGRIFANYQIGAFTITPGTDWSANSIVSADKILPFDFDGDGKQEVLVTSGAQTYILAINSVSGTSYDASIIFSTTDIVGTDMLFPGDFNGDRKTDLLVRKSNGDWKIFISRGTSFFSTTHVFNQPVNISGQYSDDKIVISDFNGDGKSDILHAFPVWNGGISTTSKFSLYYSKGYSAGSVSFFYEQYDYNHTLPLSYSNLPTGDFNGDGKSDVLLKISYQGTGEIVCFKPNGMERLLAKVADGHNNITAFEYKSLADKSSTPYVYDRTVSLDDPVNHDPFNYVQLPLYVVSGMTAPNGIGGTNTTNFYYENAVVHRYAKGFLGFTKVTAVNPDMGIKTISENEINTQWAVPYNVKQTTLRYSTNTNLSESNITNTFVNLSTGPNDIRYFQKIDKILNVDYLNGSASESVNTFDNYGNVTTNVSKVGVLSGNTVDPTETTTTSTVFGIHNTPYPAKPDNSTVSNVRTGMPSISATSVYTYTGNGNLASQTAFYGLPKAVTTTNTYNSFGNVTQTLTSASGMGNLSIDVIYDAKGRFTLSKTKSGGGLFETETATFDTKWGTAISVTSSDCQTVLNTYDAFGRLSVTNFSSLGYQVSYPMAWNINGEQLYISYRLYSAAKPSSWTWFDKQGRELKTVTEGFNNRELTQVTTYDNRGRVSTKTNVFYPYLPNNENEPALVTTTTYDDYNRPVSISNLLNTITTTYTNLSGGNVQVTAQNSAGQSQSKIIDAAGKTVSAIDNGGQLDLTYDSRGNQVETKHGNTVLVSNVFDAYGRQSSLTDRNAGIVTYEYDAYGQLTQQTDANNNSYTMTYDGLGKITTRTGTEGTTTYQYYPAGTCSANKLWKVTGFAGDIREVVYDNSHPNLLASEKVTIDGLDYFTYYTYNQYGDLTQTTYPGSVVVQNTYDAKGYLLNINGGDISSPVSLFAINSVNSHGQCTSVTNGGSATSLNTYYYGIPLRRYTQWIQDQNYTWDYSRGNLLTRSDAIKGLTEIFQYDNLNRLTNASLGSISQLDINYDGNSSFSMGNISSKTDAGNYVYKNDKVHAVAYITNPAGPTAPPVSHPQWSQDITYTPFLKTASIGVGQVVSKEFTYGADYERIKMTSWAGLTDLGSKYYFGNYEIITPIRGVGDVKIIYYVSNGEGIGAIMEKTGQYPNYNTKPLVVHYVYTDYLGSLLTITDDQRTVVAEQNFDAWGRYRDPATWQFEPQDYMPPAPFYNRGFTGHEHLPGDQLINMNGRMYDPIMGRMLSPDNYVPNPWNTQGYNRYSYANNNPLVYTDPDGNWIHLIVGAIIGGIVNLVSNAIAGNIHSFGDGLKSFGIGALQGAVGAAIAYGGFGGMATHRAFFGGFFKFSNIVGNLSVGIGSSFIPSIPFGDHFSVSPSFAFGSHGLTGGLTGMFHSGNFSFGIGFGENLNGNADGGRFSYGGGWDDGKFGLSYTHSNFSGEIRQATGSYGFHIGRISGSWENDLFASGNKDRWRTNGMGLSYSFKNGSSISVGSRFMTGEDLGENPKHPGYYLEDPNTLKREGLFYAGYTNTNGVMTSAGVDWEHGRYEVMNFIHRITGDRFFENLQSQYPLRGFIRYGNTNPFTYFW